jgi:hypothetical protein
MGDAEVVVPQRRRWTTGRYSFAPKGKSECYPPSGGRWRGEGASERDFRKPHIRRRASESVRSPSPFKRHRADGLWMFDFPEPTPDMEGLSKIDGDAVQF